MPQFPNNPRKYRCQWCFTAYATYGELTKHFEDCKAKPQVQPPKQTTFHCPHPACESSYTSFELLQSHVNVCQTLSKARDLADALICREDIGGETARALREADFEKWCRENGREVDDAA